MNVTISGQGLVLERFGRGDVVVGATSGSCSMK